MQGGGSGGSGGAGGGRGVIFNLTKAHALIETQIRIAA